MICSCSTYIKLVLVLPVIYWFLLYPYSTGSCFNCMLQVLFLPVFYWSSRKYYYYWRPIRDPSETNMPDQRLIRDWDVWSKTHRKLWHASSVTHLKQTCPFKVRHTWLTTHWRPTCLVWDQHTFLIKDTLETDMHN